MSDISKLIAEIQKDTDLLEMIKSFEQNNVASEVALKAIKSSGFDITEDEWLSAFKTGNGDIDEKKLELVVGGLVIFPPENQNGGADKSKNR